MTACLDEAGRGSLIGDVYAGAVIWNSLITHKNLKDSKKLSKKQRNEMYEFIKQNAIDYSIGFATSDEIDQINILNATHLAMHRALDGLKETIHNIKVDGNRFKKYYNIPHECIVDGDATEVGISAASILAKVEHDRHIDELVQANPDLEKYDLLHNMGYGTKNHRDAIHIHGHTQWHRKSFKFKGKIKESINE